jgi:hypothetical protein
MEPTYAVTCTLCKRLHTPSRIADFHPVCPSCKEQTRRPQKARPAAKRGGSDSKDAGGTGH